MSHDVFAPQLELLAVPYLVGGPHAGYGVSAVPGGRLTASYLHW